MHRTICLAAIISSAGLSGCASLPQACVSPARMMASAEIVFGRNIGDRIGVSDADFAHFLAQEVTLRFPDGLTVIDARGQWRDPVRKRLIQEPSKVVVVTFPDDSDRRTALSTIAEAYKARFGQQSVLISVRTVCASF